MQARSEIRGRPPPDGLAVPLVDGVLSVVRSTRLEFADLPTVPAPQYDTVDAEVAQRVKAAFG